MMSDDFWVYSHWNGRDNIRMPTGSGCAAGCIQVPPAAQAVRFWRAPDFSNAWRTFIRLQVDISIPTIFLNWRLF